MVSGVNGYISIEVARGEEATNLGRLCQKTHSLEEGRYVFFLSPAFKAEIDGKEFVFVKETDIVGVLKEDL